MSGSATFEVDSSACAWLVHGSYRPPGDAYDAGGFKVLGVFAESHCLACGAEGRFNGVPWRDGGRAVAFAEEVPREETREVLERAESLVAAESGGDEAKVLGEEGVVREGGERHRVCVWMCVVRAGEVCGCDVGKCRS